MAPVVCLDFGRPLVWLVPIAAFCSSWVKGASGVGEAIVYTLIWQMAFMAGVPETDDLGVLAALVAVSQCFSTLQMALLASRLWKRYWRAGSLFALLMLTTSPLGNLAREKAPSDLIRAVLAGVFLGFALLKVAADGMDSLRAPRRRTRQEGKQPDATQVDPAQPAPPVVLDNICVSVAEEPTAECASDGSPTVAFAAGPAQPPVALGRPPASVDRERALPAGCLGAHLWALCSGSCRGPLSAAIPAEPEGLRSGDVGDHSVQQAPSTAITAAVKDAGLSTATNGLSKATSCLSAATSAPPYPEEPSWLWWALVPVGILSGFLGGICGLNGPPFILMVAFCGLSKRIARTIFPMGQLLEVWLFRFPALVFWSNRIIPDDTHLYVLSLLAGQIGLRMGDSIAHRVSQAAFERAIIALLIVSSLSILGLLQGRPGGVVGLGAVVILLALRAACEVSLRRRSSM